MQHFLLDKCTCRTISATTVLRILSSQYKRGTHAYLTSVNCRSIMAGMFSMTSQEFEQSLDFSAINDLDPSTLDGLKIIYDREVVLRIRKFILTCLRANLCFLDQVPVEIRQHSGQNRDLTPRGTLESIKCRLLILGNGDGYSMLRLELSSEADLFFHYAFDMDEHDFPELQERQKLMIDFSHFSVVLIRMLNSCISDPHLNLAIFTEEAENVAQLDFIQNMEYKFVELLSCQCTKLSEELIQRHITFRYNSVKQKLGLMQGRLLEISNLVKLKNPSLLLQLTKAATGGVGPGLSKAPSTFIGR